MGASSARQSQRVPVDAAVRLTLCAQDVTRTLTGRAVDLSEGGIRIATDVVLAVGEGVTCSLELNDERASLSGQVRWSKPLTASADQVGIGIQWQRLSEQQNGMIQRWLNDNAPHAELVLLHVPNLREPLRARGTVNSDGLQLVAALPQLALGAEIEFQLGESGSRRTARVERVELHRRASHGGLEVSLQLQPAQVARSRRNLVYGLEGDEPYRTPTQLPAPIAPPPYTRPRRTTQPHGNPAQAACEPADPAEPGDGLDEVPATSMSMLASLERSGESASALAWGRGTALQRTTVGAESRPRARTSSQTSRDARGRRAQSRLRTERRTRSETLRVPTLSGARLRRVASWVFAASSALALTWALQDEELPDPHLPPAADSGEAAAASDPEPSFAPYEHEALPPAAGEATTRAAPAEQAAKAPDVAPARSDTALSPETREPTSPPRAADVVPSPQPAPSAPVANASPRPSAPPQDSAPIAQASPPTPPPAPAPAPAPAPVAARTGPARTQPGLSENGNRTEVFVPLAGPLDDMRSTIWRDPPAVVIELPSARLPAEISLRDLRGGGVRRVRVDETARPPQLQIFVSLPVARFATKPLAGGLLVVLEHDLRPMR